MSNELSNAERETHFNIVADDRNTVHAFSDDPVWMARLDKLATGTAHKGGKSYKLHIDQLVIRKGKKAMSDAQKAQMSERMRSMRQRHSVT